ncbi:MAG: O-antigen ligase [Gammaproteobacteria bacterium]|jgi:O-antigen ligase|nr:O-antigen ligase [Gammaproteobacteria bacterium]
MAKAPDESLFFLATRSWFWLLCIDVYPALIAASIPWSTTAVVVFVIIWFIVLAPTIEPRSFLSSLQHPASLLPTALFALAVIGMLWADGPWADRLRGLGPVVKLLAIPFFLYHFQRSRRGHWVFISFLASCALLLVVSWIIFFVPQWQVSSSHGFYNAGVPVRNVIDQNQEFALCVFALASLSLHLVKKQMLPLAVSALALALTFFFNIMFVALSRTSLVYVLALIMLFASRHFGRRATLLLLAGTVLMTGLVWFASPYLRGRFENVSIEYKEYRETNRPTSTGQRISYWTKSLEWIGEAPLIGHGTGSTKLLFEKEAVGKIGAWADSVSNPHNQTLYVAIQWGLLGCLVLFAMWFAHSAMFASRGLITWIGAVVVTQNILSSLLNSHLFDFHEGWIYVVGVGVAGGMLHNESRRVQP